MISSHTEDLSSFKKNENISNLEQIKNNKIKSDITIRPITESFEPARIDSIRDIDDFYKPNSQLTSIDSNTNTHSHLYEIMKEIISKESIYNQKSDVKENEYQHLAQYTGANSNLKNIMGEILENNMKKSSSSVNSNSKTASISSYTSDKVFDEQFKDKHLNEVITELMTTDTNKTDQSPYLNGILSEALTQSKMNTSLGAYSDYLSKTGYNSKKLSHNSDSYTDRSSPVIVDIIIKNDNLNSTKEEHHSSTQETLEQKKRIVNGVAVLPFNENAKKNSIQDAELNLVQQDQGHPFLNNIMKEIILSNNNATSSNYDSNREYSQIKNASLINKKPTEVIPVIVENSSTTSSSNKIIRQAAFEEITSSSSSKTSHNAASYHFQTESNSTSTGGKILENDKLPIAKERVIVKPIEPSQDIPIGTDKGFGLVRLTIHYDELRSRFSLTVHEARLF